MKSSQRLHRKSSLNNIMKSMILEIIVDNIYTHKMIIINEHKMKVDNNIAIDNNYGLYKY